MKVRWCRSHAQDCSLVQGDIYEYFSSFNMVRVTDEDEVDSVGDADLDLQDGKTGRDCAIASYLITDYQGLSYLTGSRRFYSHC